MLESVFVLVRGSTDPKLQLSSGIAHRDDPDPRMNKIKNNGQTNTHEDYARPDRPLSRLMRNFETGEVGHLHVLAFECVGRQTSSARSPESVAARR